MQNSLKQEILRCAQDDRRGAQDDKKEEEGTMIFLIRFLTAACLFTLLGKANVWLTPSSHATLVASYRTLLIFSPYFKRYMGPYAILMALIVSMMGVALFHIDVSSLWIMAALLTGLGLSVGGYLIKAVASETTVGAAYNKIAINAGSLLAGLILLFPLLERTHFLWIYFSILVFCCMVILWRINQRTKISVNNQVKPEAKAKENLPKPSRILQCAWALIGMVIGIKLFGVFAVLPQYLINTQTTLPNWYGITVFLSSGIIILFQLPIIKILSHWVERFHQPYLPFLILFMGMLLIATPNYFHAHTLIGAIIWTTLLAIIECCASYLDVQSSREGTLLIKETFVGIGGGITVLMMRLLPADMASMVVGLAGVLFLGLAACFFCSREGSARAVISGNGKI